MPRNRKRFFTEIEFTDALFKMGEELGFGCTDENGGYVDQVGQAYAQLNSLFPVEANTAERGEALIALRLFFRTGRNRH